VLPKFLTSREVSQRLGVPEGTLRAWKHYGRGPACFKVGVAVCYLEADVAAWEQARDQREADSA